jgi:flavin reductase (DIM6/NTAB) family NADH-FMN oxidoreductase RutF
MDIPWGSKQSQKFVSDVGLITSTGPNGPNIMAAEWTNHVSYSPGLIMLNLKPNEATLENILATKEFGVSIASDKQATATSIAGGSSGHQTDKIAVLKELGYTFLSSKHIKAPLLEGACLTIECKLLKHETIGDHIMIIGEVLEATPTDAPPLVYHSGIYNHLGAQIAKPPAAELERIKSIVAKHAKK